MQDSLIIVCDKKLTLYGCELYQASAYAIYDVARAAETDHLDLRQALLVLGGEMDGPHPLDQHAIRGALERAGGCWRSFGDNEEESIEKAYKEACKRRRDVFCTFSLA